MIATVEQTILIEYAWGRGVLHSERSGAHRSCLRVPIVFLQCALSTRHYLSMFLNKEFEIPINVFSITIISLLVSNVTH